jgi:hypothetical protein
LKFEGLDAETVYGSLSAMAALGLDPEQALLKAGALRACPRHFDIYLRTNNRDAERVAYAIWTNMLKRSDGGLQHRADLMDLLASALASASETCFICEAAYEKGDD